MRPSILDVDLEGTAMLRMLNRGPVSEGMRGRLRILTKISFAKYCSLKRKSNSG